MEVVGRISSIFLLNLIMIAGATFCPAFAASRTFTGMIGDVMCGAKHVMPGDDASCTRGCTSKGSKYALVAGDKVYTLEIMDKALLESLDKRAGQRVTVVGTEKDNTITVTSIRAAQ